METMTLEKSDNYNLLHQNNSGQVWSDNSITNMVMLNFHVPPLVKEKLDKVIEKGIWNSRSEALRYALVCLLLELKEL